MGARKRLTAEKIKEAKNDSNFAKLVNVPTSPRKMRLMADLVRGMEVHKALDILRFSSKEASGRLEKLVRSAVANWQLKNSEERVEDANLYIREVFVDSGRMLKRLRPAPQGRGHRIRKRSNHVTVYIDSMKTETQN